MADLVLIMEFKFHLGAEQEVLCELYNFIKNTYGWYCFIV